MNVGLRRSFDKDFVKLTKKLQEQFKKRRDLFISDRFHPLLDNHQLRGEYAGCRSINVTGDYRAVYLEVAGVAWFLRIGTHHELFGT